MKLVGATNWYIRLPFIIEGMMYGFIATLLCFIVLYPILRLIEPNLNNFFSIDTSATLLDLFMQHAFLTYFILLGVGLLLGVISSLIAIRRYLRV